MLGCSAALRAFGLRRKWRRGQVAKAEDCKSFIPGSNPGGAFSFFLYAGQLWLLGRARLSCQLHNTPCPGPRMTLAAFDSLWLTSRKEMNSPALVTRATFACEQKARIFLLECLATPNRLS